MKIKQVSSLDKIRNFEEAKTPINECTLLQGEVFSFQQSIFSEGCETAEVAVESKLKNYVTLYEVKKVPMDLPSYKYSPGRESTADDDYITHLPGLMPDVLIPLSEQNNCIQFMNSDVVVWAEVKVPHNFPSGKYNINICYSSNGEKIAEKGIKVEILPIALPEQELIVTQWFHTDCIASVYNVPIYGEKHWDLIDKFMKEAVNHGSNMILTPVITPPLDTKPDTERPNVQLVKITKDDENYKFDFSLLKRFIDLALKNGIKYFEISHLFSQWGLKYTPNIYAVENGEERKIFGWHVLGNDVSYKKFTDCFLPSLLNFLKKENILDNCYFHISDEPTEEHIEAYRYACDLLMPHLKGCKVMDALSHAEFYDKGLVSIPVTANDAIEPFLERNIDNQWVYYCCGEGNKVANRFLAMPSYRNKILGLQIYKYGIKGFLQWGFNFYYSFLSTYEVNPYLTTSAGGFFPSGDAFVVYPGKDGPYPSLRAKVFKEAIQDVSICRVLEKYIGKDEVIKLIEEKADMEITFSEYPRNAEFLIELGKLIKDEIKKYIN